MSSPESDCAVVAVMHWRNKFLSFSARTASADTWGWQEGGGSDKGQVAFGQKVKIYGGSNGWPSHQGAEQRGGTKWEHIKWLPLMQVLPRGSSGRGRKELRGHGLQHFHWWALGGKNCFCYFFVCPPPGWQGLEKQESQLVSLFKVQFKKEHSVFRDPSFLWEILY